MGNILNLIFDSWNSDGTFNPNLHFLNEKLGGEYLIPPHGLINLNRPNLIVNKCPIDMVDKSDNYYYIINHNCNFENIFNNETWEIPQRVENFIRNKNLNVIFLNEHESFRNLESSMKTLCEVIKNKGLNESQFYIANNNSFIYDIKERNKMNLKVHKVNYLMELISDHILVRMEPDQINFDKKFLFLCQNRRPKSHRLKLLTLLEKNNLLEDDIIDWSLTHGKFNDYNLMVNESDDISSVSNDLLSCYEKITSKNKLSYYEKDVNWFSDFNNYNACEHLNIDSFNQSYFNIISESHFDIDDIHITEKTFKSFYYFQLPIFVASYNHIKKVKQEYGFHTFDDLINHSYDDEPNNIKRMEMIISEIKRLSLIRNEIQEYYKNNLDKLIENHRIVADFHKKNVDGKFYISLTKKHQKLI